MSCTTCNNSNCSCSDNCPNKVSDITVFDCNTFNVLEVPCDASLCDVLGLLEQYTTNMVNELDTMTNVVISGDNCIGLEPGTYGIQQVIDAILTKLCNPDCPMTVKINYPIGGVVGSTVTGGTAPYTYLWEIHDDLNLIELFGDPTASTIMVSPVGEAFINFGLIKLTVTDANGCTASDTFLKQGQLIP